MCCIYVILTKFVRVRYTNLFDFLFDKRQRCVIGIFAWQWYYFEYVGDSETLKENFLERWALAFENALFNIGPTLSTAVLKANCLSSSPFLHCFSGISENLEEKNVLRTIKQLIRLDICCSERTFFWSILFLNKFPRKGITQRLTWWMQPSAWYQNK